MQDVRPYSLCPCYLLFSTGAFATRRFLKDNVVAPMPLVPVLRSALEMDRDPIEDTYSKDQLVLNYCFGHPASTLLFFPYSSTVHFINHSDHPNSYIRWSESNLSQTENFDKEIGEVYAGLIMEVVAVRDIEIGEEVTIDYGLDWADSWSNHISNWHLPKTESPINPARIVKKMNEDQSKPIMTVHEQEKSPHNPYPKCVRTACCSAAHNGRYVYKEPNPAHFRFCSIQDRVKKGDHYWYEAKMEDKNAITNIPRYAIKFVVGKYCSDMHLQLSFRHEINVPLDIYPEHWLDLLDEDDEAEIEEGSINYRNNFGEGVE